MSSRLTVLASGSAGNASLLEVDGFRLLLDAGLGPRQLARRFTSAGASWDRIRAALLTHTHSDHWKEATFEHLRRLRIPLYCHAEHARSLGALCPAFADLQTAKLVRFFETGIEFPLASGLRCRPLELRHDMPPTFGFRFERQADLFGDSWSMAYAADLGTWNAELAAALCDVDVLALEFNHDMALQQASGRPPHLIARILGDDGHLSNDQAAALLREVIAGSRQVRLRHLVQLHLSRQCNRPSLAAESARSVLESLGPDVEIHTASQDITTPVPLDGHSAPKNPGPNLQHVARDTVPGACHIIAGGGLG